MKIEGDIPNPWLQTESVSRTEQTASHRKEEGDVKDTFPCDVANVRAGTTDSTARSEKVVALQRAVATGNYNVVVDDIADAILRDWQA
jgi:anti-sigma28 factor (negative regulator of flagellin synthesis)